MQMMAVPHAVQRFLERLGSTARRMDRERSGVRDIVGRSVEARIRLDGGDPSLGGAAHGPAPWIGTAIMSGPLVPANLVGKASSCSSSSYRLDASWHYPEIRMGLVSSQRRLSPFCSSMGTYRHGPELPFGTAAADGCIEPEPVSLFPAFHFVKWPRAAPCLAWRSCLLRCRSAIATAFWSAQASVTHANAGDSLR
jgi:hypothetical protein